MVDGDGTSRGGQGLQAGTEPMTRPGQHPDASHGRGPAGAPRETYLNDPTELTVEEQRTQVDISLVGT